ncbi:MAG: sec-independent protein translocase protein TatA [Acidobacteriota bacterium]|jgi:sec-independent protein translocase protein TatA|nr:sec-independent protein translocase protein TatA [Acidobacteriota bacterium]
MINQFTVGIGGLGTPELLVIALVIFLLFGATRLPQLAKALGQSKRAFREGIDEAEAEEQRGRLKQAATSQPELSALDDEALFEEARRRAAQRRAESGEPTPRT